MLKRINWKFLFKCFAWIVSLGGIVTLMSFVNIKKRTVNCTNIKILIPGADNFIEREEIDAILKQSEGQLIGRNLENINLHAIEQRIKANPYIALSTVYADMDGVIHIEISQRQPLLRIINNGGQDYYIDRHGLKMPVSPNFTANVLVANGRILEHFGGRVDTLVTKMASDLYKTALYLKKDTLWDSQIEQIFVNDKDDIELVPRVGNQRIILGNADSLDTKMNNLLVFYKKAMPQVGWDTYKTINIKYTNQIVCEKNNVDSMNKLASGIKAPVRPTPASAKKVMDSIVKAEITAELRNNPDEDAIVTGPSVKKITPTAGKVVSAVVKKPVWKKPATVKPATVKPAAVKHTSSKYPEVKWGVRHASIKPESKPKPAAVVKPKPVAVVKPKPVAVVKPKPEAVVKHSEVKRDADKKKEVKKVVKKPAAAKPAADKNDKTDTRKNN